MKQKHEQIAVSIRLRIYILDLCCLNIGFLFFRGCPQFHSRLSFPSKFFPNYALVIQSLNTVLVYHEMLTALPNQPEEHSKPTVWATW
jgi:hypothetical protein